jgi:metal-responsive CopG/Arc/MetJ family transcriptional regulator
MKVKTPLSLSKDVLTEIDRLAGSKRKRSAFIEEVLRSYLLERRKAALHSRDLRRINRAADRLNIEATDVLQYMTSDFLNTQSVSNRPSRKSSQKNEN